MGWAEVSVQPVKSLSLSANWELYVTAKVGRATVCSEGLCCNTSHVMKVSTWTFHSDWNYHLLFPVSERSQCQCINWCYHPVCQLERFLCTLRKHPQFSALTKSKLFPWPHFCCVAQGQKKFLKKDRTVNDCLKAWRVMGTGPRCSNSSSIPVFSATICKT